MEDISEILLPKESPAEFEATRERSLNDAELWRKNRRQEERQEAFDSLRASKELYKATGLSRDKELAVERAIQTAKGQNIDGSQQEAAIKQIKSSVRADKPTPPTANLSPAQKLFSGNKDPKKRKKIQILDQWVEITVEDGKTVTKLVPDNNGLIERGKKMYPPPDLVYRRFNFVHGVPPEYHWTTDDPETRRLGGRGIQRMTVDTWLEVIEKEKDNPDGLIGPTPNGNLPRPKERGGCDCPVCTQNQARLDRLAELEQQKTD